MFYLESNLWLGGNCNPIYYYKLLRLCTVFAMFVLHTLLTFKQLLASMQWSIRISVSAELLVCVLVKNGLVTVNDPDLE